MQSLICPSFVVPNHDDRAESDRLTLPDGTIAQLRSATRLDGGALQAFFERLSPESRYRRFFSPTLPRAELIASLCDNRDPRSALTLLVILPHNGKRRIIASGSYLAKDEQSAEVALAVDDAFHGKGLGTLLLKRLAAQAVRNGFTRFWAITQADNEAMLDVFRESGFAANQRLIGREIEVNLSLVQAQEALSSEPVEVPS
jgi:GNAT superfamily N-acetyltransferase